MESRITFDTEAKAGYIYLLPDSETYTIQATEDVGDSPLLVDIDEHDRIVGIECFGEIAQRLSPIAGSEKIYHENGETLSFRLSGQAVKKHYLLKGIQFYFADEKCKYFIGFDIIDFHKYKKQTLKSIVK
ncbi:DUF2283 domain-containing protein [Cytobacillus kochii]|uniref:DUF2283 domain-containing protein n=1 Tax=Cytobacillus kochii TaxID=859143 RepID=UPI001CD63836|nr:DUF2283 domain-containing protein [Cytobacillus kochii]MCA1028080.1 DUF2283 domain-containing protein [Cytobacillus kochii]